MSIAFNYVHGTKFETVSTMQHLTDFYNLKNKSEGARRYGFTTEVVRASNPQGQVAFRAVFQTTLNGSRYQSSKYGEFVETETEAKDALVRTVASARKRYAKLAANPGSGIILKDEVGA